VLECEPELYSPFTNRWSSQAALDQVRDEAAVQIVRFPRLRPTGVARVAVGQLGFRQPNRVVTHKLGLSIILADPAEQGVR
jgi:hypothetical protein